MFKIGDKVKVKACIYEYNRVFINYMSILSLLDGAEALVVDVDYSCCYIKVGENTFRINKKDLIHQEVEVYKDSYISIVGEGRDISTTLAIFIDPISIKAAIDAAFEYGITVGQQE